MIKTLAVVLSICIVFTSQLFSQEIVNTNSGKLVLLNKDGTWKYITETDSSDNSSFDFRKTKWGFSIDQVKKSESAAPMASELLPSDLLGYDSTVGGLDASIGYYFVEDKLWYAAYVFMEKHSSDNIYLSDYGSIKSILTEKYDDPKESEFLWKNKLYATDSDKYGFAVSLGHLTLYSTWTTPATDITLMLSGDNYEIDHKLTYESRVLSKLASEKAKKSKKDVF